MTEVLPKVDVLIIGFGWTGAIMAQELTGAGLNVLALERGKWMDTATDFATTFAQDELRYYWRKDLFERPAHETLTLRNNGGQTALPMRELGSFLPGTGVGGAGIHWNGQIWRFLPSDFVARSHNLERYGKAAAPDDMTIQDYGVGYDELEPWYDKFEYLCGASRQGRQPQGADPGGRRPVRGTEGARVPQSASGHALRADPVRPGRDQSRPSPLPCTLRRTPPRPTSTPSASNSRPARSAAFARSTAAATTRRRASRPRSCRCCCVSRASP